MCSIINEIIIYSLILYSFIIGGSYSLKSAQNAISRIQYSIINNKIIGAGKRFNMKSEITCTVEPAFNRNQLKWISYVRRYQILCDKDMNKVNELNSKLRQGSRLVTLDSNKLTYNSVMQQKKDCTDLSLKYNNQIPLCERLLLQGIQLSIKTNKGLSKDTLYTGLNLNRYSQIEKNAMSLQDMMRESIKNIKSKAVTSPVVQSGASEGAQANIEAIQDGVRDDKPNFVEHILFQKKNQIRSEHGYYNFVPIPPNYEQVHHRKFDDDNEKPLFSIEIPDTQQNEDQSDNSRRMLRESRRVPLKSNGQKGNN